MTGKAKKRFEVLKQRLQKLKLQLAGATKQNDDPEEARRLRAEIQGVEQEIEKLKSE